MLNAPSVLIIHLMSFQLSQNQIEQYYQDGYIIVKSLFDAEEIGILRDVARADQALKKHAFDIDSGEGNKAKLSLWNYEGDDVYGLVSRSPRVIDPSEQLLGGEAYHYHSKMSMKEPFTGGAWTWHQDYGYWYQNGCLFPLLLSCFIAVDPNTRENGCMQVIKGSHTLGRIEHGRFGDQTGADPERVDAALNVLSLEYCVMDPGDALFFHCNTLHRSDENRSPDPRWSLICCYNAARNNPYKQSHHPSYHKLERVSDDDLKRFGRGRVSQDGAYYDPMADKTIGVGER